MEFFDENPKRRVINVDFDGVLTNGEKFWECEPTPNEKNIGIVLELYKKGYIIIIHTARMWWLASETVGWLIRYKVPFHGIYMAKGGCDYIVDDKATTLEELISQ